MKAIAFVFLHKAGCRKTKNKQVLKQHTVSMMMQCQTAGVIKKTG